MDTELFNDDGWSNEKFLNLIERLLLEVVTSNRRFPNTQLIGTIKKTMDRVRSSFTDKIVLINRAVQYELVELLERCMGMFDMKQPNQIYYEIGADYGIRKMIIVRNLSNKECIQIVITKVSIQVFYTDAKIMIDGYYPTKRIFLGNCMYKVDYGRIKELYDGDPMKILYEVNPTNSGMHCVMQ